MKKIIFLICFAISFSTKAQNFFLGEMPLPAGDTVYIQYTGVGSMFPLMLDPDNFLRIEASNYYFGNANFTSNNIDEWKLSYSWGNHSTQGYLTSESDPIWNADKTNYWNKTQADARYLQFTDTGFVATRSWTGINFYNKTQSDARYLQSFTETDPQFNTKFTSKTTSDLAEGSNLYWTTFRFDARLSLKTTSDLAEGANLYYTSARFNTAFAGKTTTDLTEGANLYYTSARFNTAFSGKSTTDLSEGSNQYFTNARARSAVSLTTTGTGSASYSSSTGVLNIPTPVAPGNDKFTSYSAGTAYNITTTPAKLDFGTTDPSVTLTAAGTYLIISNARIDYAGLTNVAANTVTVKLRRTNNTAADLSDATGAFIVPAVTLLTATGGDCDVNSVIYTTSNTNDIIELWGSRSASISVGNIQAGNAWIVALRIY